MTLSLVLKQICSIKLHSRFPSVTIMTSLRFSNKASESYICRLMCVIHTLAFVLVWCFFFTQNPVFVQFNLNAGAPF